MCGITGIFHADEPSPDLGLLDRMTWLLYAFAGEPGGSAA
jgi:hypothetical protein